MNRKLFVLFVFVVAILIVACHSPSSPTPTPPPPGPADGWVTFKYVRPSDVVCLDLNRCGGLPFIQDLNWPVDGYKIRGAMELQTDGSYTYTGKVPTSYPNGDKNGIRFEVVVRDLWYCPPGIPCSAETQETGRGVYANGVPLKEGLKSTSFCFRPPDEIIP